MLVHTRNAHQQARIWGLPAQVRAVLCSSVAAQIDGRGRFAQRIGITAIGAIRACSTVNGVRQDTAASTEWDVAVNISSRMRNVGIPHIERVDALREQCERIQELIVLRVVVEPDRGLDLSPAQAEPWLPAVIGIRPIEGRMPLAQIAEIPVVYLGADSKTIGHFHGGVSPEISECGAAGSALHGEPVVGTGIDKSL